MWRNWLSIDVPVTDSQVLVIRWSALSWWI